MSATRADLATPTAATARRARPDVVADHIRLMIFTGELRPGDRLPIDEIARAVGVSRVPVREAVKSMGSDVLLVVRPHRGAYVGDLDERFLREHFEIVGMIQGLAATSLLDRHDVPAIDRLAAMASEAEASGSDDVVYATVVEFFGRLHEMGGSTAQRAVLSALGRLLPSGWFKGLPGATDASRRGMTDIVSALRRGDPAAVRTACDRGQQERCEVVVRHLRETGVLRR